MGYVIVIAAVLMFSIVKTLTSRRMKFWRLARKYPMEACLFMKYHSDTFAFILTGNSELDKSVYSAGPFYLELFGVTNKIYANPKTLEDRQRDFINECKERTN